MENLEASQAQVSAELRELGARRKALRDDLRKVNARMKALGQRAETLCMDEAEMARVAQVSRSTVRQQWLGKS